MTDATSARAQHDAATIPARAYATDAPHARFAPTTIQRRRTGARDVRIEILYCGICHSDLHQARDEWHASMPTVYPCVPGHEIVGRVVEVGSAVKKHRVGDTVAVGCLVDSCRQCEACRGGMEQFCAGPATFTYNAPDAHLGGVTYGGYSDSVVVDEDFVLRVGHTGELAAVAPLVCAGITTYSPLRHWNVREGQRVGVIGLGGLGHMAVKFASAFGARVAVLTTSPGKAADAARLGAADVIVSRDADAMAQHAGTFDFLLDTVSAKHDVNAFLPLLKTDGTMVLVGAPQDPLPVGAMSLIFGRKRLAGSLIGGLAQTQEMLDYCAERHITADVEVIPIDRVDDAYERMLKGDVKYRFVIDMASLKR